MELTPHVQQHGVHTYESTRLLCPTRHGRVRACRTALTCYKHSNPHTDTHTPLCRCTMYDMCSLRTTDYLPSYATIGALTWAGPHRNLVGQGGSPYATTTERRLVAAAQDHGLGANWLIPPPSRWLFNPGTWSCPLYVRGAARCTSVNDAMAPRTGNALVFQPLPVFAN